MRREIGSAWRGWDAWLRTGRLAAVVAGITLLIAACGGGSHSAGSGSSSGQLTAQNLDAFAQCMRSHGVPDFYFSRAGSRSSMASSTTPMIELGGWVAPADPSSPQFRLAGKACRHVLGLPAGPPPAPTAAQLRKLVQASACMRAHGFPGFPDPTAQNGQLFVPALPAGIDTSSPQFQAAQKTCNPATAAGRSR